jgi:WXG100 family type VII secretion target
MADRIMMTPAELEDASTFLMQRLDSINSEVSSLNSKIEDISSRWEGAAQQAFIQQFQNDLYPILRDTVPQVIEGISQQLTVSAQTLRDADEAISSAIKG